MKKLGIVLLFIGLMVTIYTSVYVSRHNDIDQSNSMPRYSQAREPIYWAPAAGSIMIVAGIVIAIGGKYMKQGY